MTQDILATHHHHHRDNLVTGGVYVYE
jgi:hypothetical protein